MEKRLKSSSRKEKATLVAEHNPRWSDLYEELA